MKGEEETSRCDMGEARQIKGEVSEATTAQVVMKDQITEAKGKGLTDEIMEVKEVTDSSVPLQPKSNTLASDSNSGLRQRLGLQKKSNAVIKLQLDSKMARHKALKLAAGIPGVESVGLGGQDKNLLEVVGDEFDAVHLTTLLRKKIGVATLVSVGQQKNDIVEDEPLLSKEEEDDPMLQPLGSLSFPHHLLTPINEVQSVVLNSVETEKLNGGMEMEMETKADTRSNRGSGNAELSSCTSKTTEWTLLIASLLLEGISAISEQLGYALTAMVMAFLGLLLSIIDLIRKARKEGIKGDGRSLLPCFSRHLSHNSPNCKPFGSLVEYFGLAGAIWQCYYSTTQYYYNRQNLGNPIKMCLLPFIFALCVVISKFVKSSPHEIR